jgi:hypothetical protein
MSAPAAPTPTPRPQNAPLPDEQTIRTFRESKWRFAFWFKTIITLSIWYWSIYRHNSLTLTTLKVTQRRGSWVSHNETALYINDIRDITTNQSILGRIFGYGDIAISSSGGTGSEIAMRGMSDANLLRELLFDLRDGDLDSPKLQSVMKKT